MQNLWLSQGLLSQGPTAKGLGGGYLCYQVGDHYLNRLVSRSMGGPVGAWHDVEHAKPTLFNVGMVKSIHSFGCCQRSKKVKVANPAERKSLSFGLHRELKSHKGGLQLGGSMKQKETACTETFCAGPVLAFKVMVIISLLIANLILSCATELNQLQGIE